MIGLVIILIAFKGLLLTIVGSSNPLANKRFEKILEVDGILLDGMEYNYRLDVFTSQCENMTKDVDDPCPYANSQYMYTDDEKDRMKGAERDVAAVDDFMVEGADEELFKRLEVDLPTSYDIRDDVEVRVVSQGVCANCYLQAVIGALEIAYYKHTGEIVHFSAQELTECFFRGCDGADPKHVIQFLSHIDHLSSQMEYGRYLAGRGMGLGTCKTATTPDSLLKVKVLGYKVISADEIDHYVYMNGAVVVCLDWDTNCKLNNYEGGVYDDKTREGCEHAVIIVGYTPDYWIVKNSHGLSWGENGYFRIKRGSNVCGIENYPLAIITEQRKGNKEGVHPYSHCPLERPNYCEDIHTCTKESSCTESIITGKYSQSAEGALGHCVKPNITNGSLKIVGNENIIEAGEEFRIECSPGFVLLGQATMECVIQEVYKPDTRMIPECVPQSSLSEEYTKNGIEYSGTKNKTSIGNSCWNWMEVWITGRASTAIGKNQFTRENFLEGGNHNFCRNVGGNKPVPFCLERRYTETGKLQSKFNFCFTSPSCDTISCGEVEDKHRSCSNKADKCAYGKYSQHSTDKNWVNCKKTCCEVSGC